MDRRRGRYACSKDGTTDGYSHRTETLPSTKRININALPALAGSNALTALGLFAEGLSVELPLLKHAARQHIGFVITALRTRGWLFKCFGKINGSRKNDPRSSLRGRGNPVVVIMICGAGYVR
jgi:hypothetical protein